jgi:hypothetical protein
LENAADYLSRNRKSKELLIPVSIPFSQQNSCLAIDIAKMIARDPLNNPKKLVELNVIIRAI